METSKHTRLRTITVTHHKRKYIYCLLTYKDILYTYTRVFCYFGHLGMGRAVYSAVVMEMGSACQLKSTEHLLVLSPASYCAPRLNRQKNLWTSGYIVIQNKSTALTGWFFFFTSRLNSCLFSQSGCVNRTECRHSVCVDVWSPVCMCVCVCVICSLPRFYF